MAKYEDTSEIQEIPMDLGPMDDGEEDIRDLMRDQGVEYGEQVSKDLSIEGQTAGLLRNMIREKKLNIDIEIDGGINFNNSKEAKEHGANILVSGSTVFKENNGNLKKNIQLLRSN